MARAWLAVTLLTALGVASGEPEEWKLMREQMINEIHADMRYVGEPLNAAVTKALRSTPRHEFVPEQLQPAAYRNQPLPIGEDQTISQPFIVALMTHLLDLDGCGKVLEIGTGSGYQAAVLSELCDEVYTIEIIGALAKRATDDFSRLGYDNIHVRHGDGMLGWPEHAPFDGIMVTAVGPDVPDTLMNQLAPGGKLVLPVGPVGGVQQLKVVEQVDGRQRATDVLPVRFVPVTHDVR